METVDIRYYEFGLINMKDFVNLFVVIINMLFCVLTVSVFSISDMIVSCLVFLPSQDFLSVIISIFSFGS